MRAGLVLLAVALGLLVAPARPEPGTAELASGYAERVVGAGILELPPDAVSTAAAPSLVRNGRRTGSVRLLDVAVAVPGALAARMSSAAPMVSALRSLFGVLLSIVLFATAGSIFFARLHRKSGLGLSASQALLATLAMLFGTSLLFGARRADATLFAVIALQLLLDELGSQRTAKRHFIQMSLLACALTLASSAYGATALALVLLDVLRRRPRAGVGVAAAFALVPVAAALVVGHVWDARVGLAVPASGTRWHAIYGLLLSPGRSVFVFAPLALAGLFGWSALWSRSRERAEAIAISIATALFVIGGRADWHGDPAYGAPLLLPLLPLFAEPAALLLAGTRAQRRGFALAAAAGVAIQVLGLVVDAQAWPRVVADVRAATGAPGWFLDPAADIEFVPQLSPIVGQVTLARIAYGHDKIESPPFSLVVGSDQAEPVGRPAAAQVAWIGVRDKIDRAMLRPNLAFVSAPRGIVLTQLAVASLALLIGMALLARARRT
jgi:hypothetical protein